MLSLFFLAHLTESHATESQTVEDQTTLPAPEITGTWIQGALLRGKTAPGNKVKFNQQDVFVSREGYFFFGLDRDESRSVSLEIVTADAKSAVFTYEVEQRDYPTQRIEGVEQKYVDPPPAVLARIQRETEQVTQARKIFSEQSHIDSRFSWPLDGPITGVFGSQRIFNGVPKRPHFGLDIAGAVGALVSAPAGGTVTLVHRDMYFSGGTLIIDHGQGVSSTFIHLSEILVEQGEQVKVGQAIAKVGATGRTTGPHLDWRINWFDKRLDPLLHLPERKTSQAE